MKKIRYLSAVLTCQLGLFAQLDQTTAIAHMNTLASSSIISPVEDDGAAGTLTPEVVSSNFNHDFPNTTATWRKDGKNYKACYTDSLTKLRRALVYDKHGVVVNQSNELDYSQIPYGIIYFYKPNTPKEKFHVC